MECATRGTSKPKSIHQEEEMQSKTRMFVSAVCGLAILALAACGTAAPAATAVPPTNTAAATASGGGAAPEATAEPAKPSNPGGPGPAVALTGDAKAGAQVFVDNCKKCHGDEGKGGVSNPGSTDGTVPALNPIDETIANKDPKVFAQNMDLFIEHGSTPAGDKPQNVMKAFGDQKLLTPQQIADVMAYVISLNPPK
jgi:mono/diheme cytochrome c family protein